MPFNEILADQFASGSKHEEKNGVELCLINVGSVLWPLIAVPIKRYAVATERSVACRYIKDVAFPRVSKAPQGVLETHLPPECFKPLI
ncbi:hypothetical protein D3C80_1732340 [compost metagenome]